MSVTVRQDSETPRPAGKRRLRREKRTIRIMIGMYCAAHHGSHDDQICPQCTELHSYAMARIDRCVFKPQKPTCAHCPVHCYKPVMRDKVRKLMAWSGPRMMKRHPYLAVMHLVDGLRKVEHPVERLRK